MSSEDTVQTIINEFSAQIGLENTTLDASGRLSLNVGPMEVSFSSQSEPTDLLWLIADLGPLPDDEDAVPFLLNAAFFAWIADSMTIALDDESNHVLGYTAIPLATLTRDSLRTSFERLVTAALEIRRCLADRDFEPLVVEGNTAAPADHSPGVRV